MFWIGLGIGLMCGAVAGFLCAALCSISAKRKHPVDYCYHASVDRAGADNMAQDKPMSSF